MQILTYDIKRTHEGNPDCPMRIAPHPRGGVYCVDCGLEIMWKWIDVNEDRGRTLLRDFQEVVGGTPRPGWWKDEKGRMRSPLDDPDCPFLLESDESPK